MKYIKRQRLKYYDPDPPLQGFSPVAYATIRRSDGTLHHLAVSFLNEDGEWQGEQAWFPNYSAHSRISFKPEKGDAFSMLETHLGSIADFRAVEDKPGIFDVFGFDSDADRARENADIKVVELRESLDEFDLGKHLKVVTPAEKPELPYMGEREPPFVEPKP